MGFGCSGAENSVRTAPCPHGWMLQSHDDGKATTMMLAGTLRTTRRSPSSNLSGFTTIIIHERQTRTFLSVLNESSYVHIRR